MRYRLRTLLIVLAVAPALVGMACWAAFDESWRRELLPAVQAMFAISIFFAVVFPAACGLAWLAGVLVKNRRIGESTMFRFAIRKAAIPSKTE